MSEKVYFIRHKHYEKNHDKHEKILEKKLISIFYDNEPFKTVVLNTDYTGDVIKYNNKYFENKPKTRELSTYKSALNFFWLIGKNGGIIVAEYQCKSDGKNEIKCLLGRVKPGTKVEEFNEYKTTLQLENTQPIDYNDYPVMLAVRPPYNTICEPTSEFFKEIIPAIYSNTLNQLKLARKMLHPKMLEQMCVEYLLKVPVVGEKLDYCILRPGKSLAVIDIAGISENGKRIYAQVKADVIDNEEYKKFSDFVPANDSINIIFSDGIAQGVNKDNNIEYINVDDVFNYFLKKNKIMVEKMIGF